MECLLFPVSWFTRSVRSLPHKKVAIIQVEKVREEGKLLWLFAQKDQDKRASHLLLEHSTIEAAGRGCLYLTASVDPDSPTGESLLDFGFHVIGEEQVWQYAGRNENSERNNPGWRKTSSSDLSAIQRLQNSMLSPAEKLVSRSVLRTPPQYSLVIEGEIRGFAHINRDRRSVVAMPFYSNTVDSPHKISAALLDLFFTEYAQLYILFNSGEIWSDSTIIKNFKLIQAGRFRMVKHLAVRTTSAETALRQFNNGRSTDVITPLSKAVRFKDKI